MSQICLSDITRESLAAWTEHNMYLNIFVCKNVACAMTFWQCNDIRKFNAGAILFWDDQCKNNSNFRFKWCF